ncbi:hypothetical protein NpNSSI1_00004044 [Neofusicoccum parvum]|nr:hypothetical protein NpNSSI1_00004044 [Neofusicoccum parvum]
MSSLQTTPSKRISSGVLLPYPREWFVSKTLPPDTITTPCIVEYPSAPSLDLTTPSPPSSSFIGWFPPATATDTAPDTSSSLHLRIGLDMQTDYDNDPNASTATATPLLWLRLAIATSPAKGAAPRGTAELDEFIYLVMPANRFYAAAPGGKTGSLTLTRYADQPARWRVPAYVRDAMGASAARLCRADMCVLELSLVRAPMALMAGRWMRCASALDEGLVGDMREVQGCTRVRVHVAWTRELERMVDALDGMVEEATRRGDGEDECPLVKGRRVMGEEGRVAVNAWGNFLESGSDEVVVVDHKVSSNAERDGLVMTSKEFAEARKRKRAEEKEKARAEKKAKVEKEARADSRAVAEAEKSQEMSKKKKVVEVFKKTNTEDMEITYD